MYSSSYWPHHNFFIVVLSVSLKIIQTGCTGKGTLQAAPSLLQVDPTQKKEFILARSMREIASQFSAVLLCTDQTSFRSLRPSGEPQCWRILNK